MATLTITDAGKTVTVKLLSGFTLPPKLDGSFSSFRCWFVSDSENINRLLRIESDGNQYDLAGVDWISSSSGSKQTSGVVTMAQS